MTPFKKISEYVIIGILLVSLWQLYRDRRFFNALVMRLLAASIVTTMAAEMAFTLYVGFYDLFNLVGHMLKIISFFLIFKAIIETGLARPYDLLFRELQEQKRALEAANREMIEGLEHARRTQQALLPQAVPVLPGGRIAARYVPMHEVGGDLYDFLALPGGRLGIMVADVVGHGVSAALIASMVSTLFKTFAPHHSSISGLFKAVNESLAEKLPLEGFVTVFMCSYEPDTRLLRYASAGHPEAYVVGPGHGKAIPLQVRGVALGLLAGGEGAWDEGEWKLGVGDKVFLYTDGLTEARNPAGEMYEQERLQASLSRLGHSGVDDLVNGAHADLVRFAAKATFEDDIALVGLEITGEG